MVFLLFSTKISGIPQKNALIGAVQHFFKTGHMLKALNCTFIALIPKKKKASRVDHFRPISLCNVTYKTVSKIIAHRLKAHLHNCISPFQMAFVAGRNIHDNSIVSHEIMHYLHLKKGPKGFMAIKVDLAKAFDRVEWDLFICIRKKFGFCSKFTDWILECISSSSMSFLINGSPFGNLTPSRGIRQGDPLSPFLFVIYIELLSRMLAKEEQLNHFKGIKISRTSPSISHLLYADDLVIFCRANTDDATCINEVINKFSVWSSQCANKEKSSIHFSNNTSHHTKLDITNILGFPECNHKTKHLGFSFCKPKSRKDAFLEVSDRITTHLSGWKSKLLSQASKTILIKAVAQAIPTYTMSISLCPISICNKIDGQMRKILVG